VLGRDREAPTKEQGWGLRQTTRFQQNSWGVWIRCLAKCPWLTPAILVTWEAKIGRITVQGQPGLIV
jgi:hypothetical protein